MQKELIDLIFNSRGYYDSDKIEEKTTEIFDLVKKDFRVSNTSLHIIDCEIRYEDEIKILTSSGYLTIEDLIESLYSRLLFRILCISKNGSVDIRNLFNWTVLSSVITGGRSTLRKSFIPQEHIELICDLEMAVSDVFKKHGNSAMLKGGLG